MEEVEKKADKQKQQWAGKIFSPDAMASLLQYLPTFQTCKLSDKKYQKRKETKICKYKFLNMLLNC